MSSVAAVSAESVKAVELLKNTSPAVVVVPLGPEDDYDRSIPRSSVKRFLEAAKNRDYESAAQHLDLRTLDNTVIAALNGAFSKLHLKNYTLREKIWFHPEISLPYESTWDQISTIASGIENLLQGHPEVLDEPLHVYYT